MIDNNQKTLYVWKLINTLLNNPYIKGENIMQTRIYFEMNDNEIITDPNL